MKLTIGTLAKAGGVGVETIRFYERKGLIQKPPKKTSGFRVYTDDDARRIRFIKRAQNLGFTLKEIKDLLDMATGARKSTCGDVKEVADAKVAEIELKIADLNRMKDSLLALSSACGRKKRSTSPRTSGVLEECRVMECFEEDCEC